MKKLLTVAIIGATITSGASAVSAKHPCVSRVPPIHVHRPPVIVHHDNHSTEYLIAGAIIGTIIGVILFSEPVNPTRASVRF